MSACCATSSLESQFDARKAERQLRAYRKNGAAKETRLLIEGLAQAGVTGASVLDVGAGVGAVQEGLIDRGAARVVSVDASSAYQAAAQTLASERGFRERIDYRVGDFVDVAPGIEDADVVTLDKVICCYPDVERLVGLSADRARRLYGLVYPHDGALVRAMTTAQNGFRRLLRNEFRTWIHSGETVAGMLRDRGFRLRYEAASRVWRVRVFER